VKTVSTKDAGQVQQVSEQVMVDKGRAYHSSYFEMLGEQGFPGLILFLLIHGSGLVGMERIRRRYRKAEGEDAWISPLATALQHFQIVYLIGGLFVGIAFQPFMLMVLAVQVGFGTLIRRRERAERPAARGFAPAPARAPDGAEPA
jgi:O-antigen ligase